MAEENFNTGSAPDTASTPAQTVQDQALAEMARDENPENYIKERAARDAEAKGEEVNGEDRSARIREALAKARQDTQQARAENGLDQPDLDQQYETAEQEWQAAHTEEATFESEREVARAEGKFQAVAEQLKQSNPQTWQQITDNLGAFDAMVTPEQGEAFKRALIAGSPQEGLAIVHRLSTPTYNPDGSIQMSAYDKIAHIASLPPQEITRIVNQARDWLTIEHTVAQKYAAAYAAQGRRVSKAPPPFKAPRGGANPPQNLSALASKGENPSDYIKLRRQQMKRGRDE